MINATNKKAEKMKQELSEEIAALNTKITTLLSDKYKYPTMMVIVPLRKPRGWLDWACVDC